MSINRRNFIKLLGGATLLTVVPRRVLGGPNHVAPSDQLTKGIIGVGGIGKSKYHFTSDERCRLVAVCDVDRRHLRSAVELGHKKFNETLQAYEDYRDLIADPNVDIVHIATPPHWHGIMAVEAARGQGHLVRETHDAHHRREPPRGRSRQAQQPHLPPQHVVPLQGHLLRAGDDGRTAQKNSSTAGCWAGR